MRRIILVILVIFVAIVGWRAIDSVLFIEKHRNEYFSFWIDHFGSCDSISEIKNLPSDLRPDLIVTRSFPDGSWLAAVTTSMDDYRSFEAAMLYDSTRAAFAFSESFSGYIALDFEINSIKSDTLKEFYANATKFGLHKIPPKTK